jgi:hypothetical protein
MCLHLFVTDIEYVIWKLIDISASSLVLGVYKRLMPYFHRTSHELDTFYCVLCQHGG